MAQGEWRYEGSQLGGAADKEGYVFKKLYGKPKEHRPSPGALLHDGALLTAQEKGCYYGPQLHGAAAGDGAHALGGVPVVAALNGAREVVLEVPRVAQQSLRNICRS